MAMTKPQAMKIAHLAMEIRPGWDFAGIMAALAKAPETSSLADTAVAMITAAQDPGAMTPAVAMANRVYWPSWSVASDADRDQSRRDRLERQRAANIRAEWAQSERRAATADQIRNIRKAQQ